MAFRFLKHSSVFRSIITPHLHLRICSLVSIPTRILFKENNLWNDVYNMSPLLPGNVNDLTNCNIDLVDDETWNVSSGLAEAWRINNNSNNSMPNAGRTVRERRVLGSEDEDEDEVMEYLPPNKENPDLDEIEDMRIRGSLFYKLEKGSEEYEDNKFDFHGRKHAEKKKDKKEEKVQKKENKRSAHVEKVVNNSKGRNEITKKETWTFNSLSVKDHNQEENLGFISRFDEVNGYTSKPKRKPSFKQVTAPYHEPFCLDLQVTKGSARACVIHRVTSKVVVVAHSISKDLKCELGSPKSRAACALVGKVLAQRAVDDDIYNIVYRPRRGDKLEGKLLIVLQAIIDGGIEVKVKLKQKKARTHGSVLKTYD